MKLKFLSLFFGLILCNLVFAQETVIERVEPPSWWVGMADSNLQVMVYGKEISQYDIKLNNPEIEILKINKTDNPNYVFIDLKIGKKVNAGTFNILLSKGRKSIDKYEYKLDKKKQMKRGFSNEDLFYMIMPDRFANGDESNDISPEALEKANRDNKDGRHGGDIKGVIDNLDYIKSMGFTGIWLNPIVENNMPEYSYHGYASTNFYKIDPRHGTNEQYKEFVDKSHEKGIKVIKDIIFNHCATNHWWIKDLPAKDWVNNNENFRTSYRGEVATDIYASEYDKQQFNDGWFVATMPDLNQRNPFLAKYFEQNTIWWIEYAGLDGIRIDTYTYPDRTFSTNLNIRLKKEYPDITILGETWLQGVPYTAYFQAYNNISGNYNSYLDCVTDFPLYYATKDAFNQEETWTDGLFKIYYVLAQDFLYPNPDNAVIFLDNHDLSRYFTSVGEDIKKYKMGVSLILTMRGIPVIYYGTEIAMTGEEHKGHGYIREDFPGGWKNDKINIFKQQNLLEKQKTAFDYFKKIANWRQTNNAVKTGKFMHFLPENNVYVYFKYTDKEAVMVVLNNHKNENRTIDCTRFNEILKNYKKGKVISNKDEIIALDKITISSKSALIIELQK